MSCSDPAADRLLARRSIALDRALSDLKVLSDRVSGLWSTTIESRATRLPRLDPIASLAADVDRHLAEVRTLDGALDDIGCPRPAALS